MGARRFLGALVVVVSMALVASTAAAPGSQASDKGAAASGPGHARDLAQKAANKKSTHAGKKKVDTYKPARGVLFNNPLGRGPARYAVFNKIQNAIRHAPGTADIRIMSWNIMSRTAVTALLAAQQRGARIRVLMDNTNLVDIPNPYFARLRAGFKAANKSMPMKRRSYAKTCIGSCRGDGGSSHAKFYLFSKTGKARNVLMQGSANLTAASAVNQWNDIYTFVGNKKLYNFANDIYDQMWKDTPVEAQFAGVTTKNGSLYFSPYRGSSFTGDPVQSLLDQVQCTGVTKGAGVNGHTVIRVAPDVMRNERGMRAAQRLRDLYNQGCDVKIGYTVMGVDIFRFLRAPGGRGPVPLVHLVQDFDGDKEFDNYFHLKAITINGVVGSDTSAYYVVNGSSNISGLATVSDENIGIIKNKTQTLKYQDFITYWINNPPPNARPIAGRDLFGRLLVSGPVNPYAHVDMD